MEDYPYPVGSSPAPNILARLEHIAADTLPWQPLDVCQALLRQRLMELRTRQSRVDGALIVVVVGGSGVGKSTLLNALAGDVLAETSEFRPCTSVPTVYYPPSAYVPFAGWNHVAGSALDDLILIDTPDSDTIMREHRELVQHALAQCDLILLCGSPEKYFDEATWSLLRPLRHERRVVCVETKAEDHGYAEPFSIRAQWLERMCAEDMKPIHYFRIDAFHALQRKLTGKPSGSEHDFTALETFLRTELTRTKIEHIKCSNIAGLLRKTVAQLHETLAPEKNRVDELLSLVHQAPGLLAQDISGILRARLFGEPSVWTNALADEISHRARGAVCGLYRMLHSIRSLSVRRLPWPSVLVTKPEASTHALCAMESTGMLSAAIEEPYRMRRGQIALAMTRAGFTPDESGAGLQSYRHALEERLGLLVLSPAHGCLSRASRWLASPWLAWLLDLPPGIFAAVAGWRAVQAFFSGALLDSAFFLHAGTVLVILVGAELFIYALAVRFASAWVRHSVWVHAREQLGSEQPAFDAETRQVLAAAGLIKETEDIARTLDTI